MKVIKEKMNIYICEHGCHNITVNVDKGVTPFMMKCLREGDAKRPLDKSKSKNGVCVGMAKSCMYPERINDAQDYPVAKHEWYRPDNQEYSALNNAEKDHVRNGGLLIRKITGKKPILHSENNHYSLPEYEALPKPMSNVFGKRFF